ncbi:MAG: PEGA domain-containing protein [Gammaproteobacteria bacterium]|nr:PEGA domain-containing protein [Gammaproteobacteria bacterium]
MKIKLNLMIFFVFVYVFLMIQSLSVFAELIEPSRTVKGQEISNGRLSVFSEPPELDVLLDGVEIGKTPVISKEVTPGVHILRVKDTEKEITILSGKSLQLSLFKDSLIEIPEKKAEAPTQPKLEEKMATEEKKTEDSNKDKKQYDPFYWPLNPSGPIK